MWFPIKVRVHSYKKLTLPLARPKPMEDILEATENRSDVSSHTWSPGNLLIGGYHNALHNTHNAIGI